MDGKGVIPMGWGGNGQRVRTRREEDARLFIEEQRHIAPVGRQWTRRQRRLFVIAIGLLAAAAFLVPLVLRSLG